MLRVARLTDRSGRYYLDDRSAQLGVGLRGGGRWTGRGAAALGLDGPAGAEGLGALLSGRHPGTGRPLRRRETGVCGYDLTFAAPKSVSVLFGLGGPDIAGTVAAAHSVAVDQAMDYVSAHALAVRRGSGEGRYLLGTDGAIGATYTHALSRVLDPHLHTHVVVGNVVHGADGRWTAIDGRGLWAHARAAGALYDAHLRHQLSNELGLEWRPRRNGAYELSAVDPFVIGALSGRQAEIRNHLADRVATNRRTTARPGPGRWRSGPSARARAVAWGATRAAKPATVTTTELRDRWLARAMDAGYHPNRLESGLSPEAQRRSRSDPRATLDEHRFAASLVITAGERPTRRAAVAAWAGAVEVGVPAAAVERCVDRVSDWGRAIGVAEEVRPLAGIVAAPHLLRALGPRPSTLAPLGVWQEAAAAVDRYRSHWPLEDPRQVLGIDPAAALDKMGARRLAQHLAVSRTVEAARRHLGRGSVREPEVPELSLGRG